MGDPYTDTIEPLTPSMSAPDANERTDVESHYSAIDGLRALAVIAVLIFHMSAHVLPGGFLGVDLFFVISGFVITRYLNIEQQKLSYVELRKFWARRARRLLPALLLLILAVQIWSHARGSTALTHVVKGQSWSSLLYVSNWWSILSHVGYFNASLSSSPLNHLWSLAIEEQFYIVWPLIVFAAATRRRVGVTAAAMALASAALQLWQGQHWDFNRVYLGTDTRIVAILVGAVLASALMRPTGDPDHPQRLLELGSNTSRAVVQIVAVAAAAAVVGMWLTTTLTTSGLFRGQLLLATGCEAVLLAAVLLGQRGPVGRVLSTPPMVFVGKRSYALYLWHWPILTLVTAQSTHFKGPEVALVRAGMIVGATVLSYTFVENPIRRGSLSGLRLVAALGAPVVALAAFTLTFRPALSARQRANQASAPATRTASGGATVLEVGDSWARNLGVGMVNVDTKSTIINLGLGGCGIADPAAYRTADRGTYATPPECFAWKTDWAHAMSADHPSAVVLTVGNWDQAIAEISGNFVQPCDTTFDQRYAMQLDTAVTILTANGTPLFITTVIAEGRSSTAPATCMNRLLRDAAKRHPNVSVLDFGNFICPGDHCQTVRSGSNVFDDTGHLAPFWQSKAASWVLAAIYSKLASTTSAPASPFENALPTASEVALVTSGSPTATTSSSQVVFPLASTTMASGCGDSTTWQVGRTWAGANASVVQAAACGFTSDVAPDALAAAGISDLLSHSYTESYLSDTRLTEVLQKTTGTEMRAIIFVRARNKLEIIVIVTNLADAPNVASVAQTVTARLPTIG